MYPKLEYASSIWEPHIQSNISKIEAMQHRAARFATRDYRRISSVSSMLEHLGWENLYTHRQHGKMVLMYRIVNHLVEIPASTVLQPVGASRTRGHNHGYLVPYCGVDAYKFAFFPSGIWLWNSLPTETASAQSLESFKTDHGLMPINTDVDAQDVTPFVTYL